jgi:hypothetical protein
MQIGGFPFLRPDIPFLRMSTVGHKTCILHTVPRGLERVRMKN